MDNFIWKHQLNRRTNNNSIKQIKNFDIKNNIFLMYQVTNVFVITIIEKCWNLNIRVNGKQIQKSHNLKNLFAINIYYYCCLYQVIMVIYKNIYIFMPFSEQIIFRHKTKETVLIISN